MTLLETLQKQLDTESKSACERLTAANLDTIYKLTSSIYSLKNMEAGEVQESTVSKYSNGKYDHNIDELYDAYLAAKQAFQASGDHGHRNKLMEAVGRLMAEIYDLLSAMIIDSDFKLEKDEIKRSIRMLADM